MKTLVLNIDYSPLCVVSAKRAVCLYLNNPNIKALNFHTGLFRSEKECFEIPSVLLYTKYVRLPARKNVSKKYVLRRDEMICQYCEKRLDKNTASVDHIIPQSRNGQTSWENLVACCKPCNAKKRNRLPEEAGMRLIKKPKQPNRFIYFEEDEWKQG
jgi:5-methylcytosine-specific restriction endonuclease McrA